MIEETISKVKEAESKADQIVADARAQAREIRQDGERQSKQILEQAAEESVARLKEARDGWRQSEQREIDVMSSDGKDFPVPTGTLAERMPAAVEAVKELILK
ncbi:MAG: hypothetical protein SOH58_01025 [Olsenella sp.]